MKIIVSSLLAMIVLASAATAAPTVIDFEAYADYQNLNGVNLGGVTLTNPSGKVEIYDNRFGVASHSGTKAVGSFSGNQSVNPLVGVFDVATNYVSLWAGDGGGDSDRWELKAYDAVVGGNLLGSAISPITNGYPYTQLTIAAAGIMRFEAYWVDPKLAGVGYDDLEFGSVVPAPGAILLASIGVSCVGWIRRRKLA